MIEDFLVAIRAVTLGEGLALLPRVLQAVAGDAPVLVDGKRRHTSAMINVNGSIGRGSSAVDINAIPIAAIERVEEAFGVKNVSYLAYPEKPWASKEMVLETKNKWFELPNGFKANYFNNPTLSGAPVLNRTENQIDHHWTLYGPSELTGNGFYAARWEAQLIGKQNTTIELGLAGNDGFRLYLNDTLRIDQWEKQSFHQRKIAIDVREGQPYQLRIEFREPQGNGRIKLFVEEPRSEVSQAYLELEKHLDSDVAIVVVDYPEGEFQDRSSLALAPEQIKLIKELIACGLPVVVVVVGGSVALGFGATFFNAAQRTLDELCTIEFSRKARIVPTRLSDEGPLIGASAVGWRGLNRMATVRD